jgi:hypothetical protein
LGDFGFVATRCAGRFAGPFAAFDFCARRDFFGFFDMIVG